MKDFLQRIQNKKIAIFSTTDIAKYLKIFIEKQNINTNIIYFVDSFKKGVFENITILTPEEASKKKDIEEYIVASKSHEKVLEDVLLNLNVKNIVKIPADLFEEIDKLIAINSDKTELYPTGHYYSAVPSSEDFQEFYDNKSDKIMDFPDIDLNMQAQLDNLKYFDSIYDDYIYNTEKNNDSLYYTNNVWFFPYDAKVLEGMIRKYRPNRIIEVGSGFSTGAMIDINKKFFNNKINITSIEPNPERLFDVLGAQLNNINFIKKRVQEVDLSVFKNLQANDILFIDSSHVGKINSDVIKIFNVILPILNKNVIIHFHDIFNNFSYPRRWILQKRAWNEAFFLRTFLQYNNAFKIEYYCDYMRAFIQQNEISTKLPIKNGSGSFWIKKIV